MHNRTGRTYRVTAVILRRKNTGETDRILTVFSREHGKQQLIAKGVRKTRSRRNAHLELFNETLMMVHQGKTWDIISQAEAKHMLTGELTELWQVSAAYFCCELVDAVLPYEEPNQPAYGLLTGMLSDLPKTDRTALEARLVAFATDLLSVLGFLDEEHRASLKRLRDLVPYIERVSERKMKTPRILWNLKPAKRD